MTAAIRYLSKTGNTKKLADEIAYMAKSPALSIDSSLTEPVDVLFVGAAIYKGKLDPKMAAFLNNLDPSFVPRVAVFGTSVSGKSVHPLVVKALADKSIQVLDEKFDARGKMMFMAKKHPTVVDMANVVAFAVRVMATKI